MEHFQVLAVVSLPQFAFAHYDAAVKASLVFLRRLEPGETVPDETPIFMALAENVGYDAAGRKTFNVTVESAGEERTDGQPRIERLTCDLFDFRAYYEWNTTNPKKPAWSEKHREILPNTGLVAEWNKFQTNPKPFFV